MDLNVTTVLYILAILVTFYGLYLVLSLRSRIPCCMALKSILNQPRKLEV